MILASSMARYEEPRRYARTPGTSSFEPSSGAADRLLQVLFDAVRQALARDQQAREERLQRQALRLRFKRISPRERDVLRHILLGRLNKQIASDLGINERTVKVHRRSIMIKRNVQCVAALARLSQEAGVSRAALSYSYQRGAWTFRERSVEPRSGRIAKRSGAPTARSPQANPLRPGFRRGRKCRDTHAPHLSSRLTRAHVSFHRVVPMPKMC